MRKRVKQSAGQDKRQFIATTLRDESHGSAIEQWKQVRQLRNSFRQQSANLFNMDRKLVSREERFQTLADYLSESVWKAPDRPKGTKSL